MLFATAGLYPLFSLKLDRVNERNGVGYGFGGVVGGRSVASKMTESVVGMYAQTPADLALRAAAAGLVASVLGRIKEFTTLFAQVSARGKGGQDMSFFFFSLLVAGSLLVTSLRPSSGAQVVRNLVGAGGRAWARAEEFMLLFWLPGYVFHCCR